MLIFIKILGILVISFNLFTIWKIYKSDIYQKWWKYLLPLFVNFPTFIATKEAGLVWKLLSFQLLGSNLEFGYQGYYAIAAIPIGSLYAWWKLSRWKLDKEYDHIEKWNELNLNVFSGSTYSIYHHIIYPISNFSDNGIKCE